MNSEPEIEFIDLEQSKSVAPVHASASDTRPARRATFGVLGLTIGLVVWLVLSAYSDRNRGTEDTYRSQFTAESLRELLHVVGGLEGLTVAEAEGSFDLVRFDPSDRDQLLATNRSSYGEAQNQDVNEIWRVSEGGNVEQTLWAPSDAHDFVHYNADGTVTAWAHGGGVGYAPRRATLLGRDGQRLSSSGPMFASRFTADGGTVFALTGNGDYYTDQRGYVDLIADAGDGPILLDDGSLYAWIDNPAANLLLAYPVDRTGSTSVWDVTTLELLPHHPLAGRSYRRAAISGDSAVAVGVTFAGKVEIVDLETGVVGGAFGEVDVEGIDLPLTLNQDGTILWTVEHRGRVTMWWVGDDEPIATTLAHAVQPRWRSAEYAAISASTVASDASRLALRIGARPGSPTRWRIIDTDVASWVAQACELAERSIRDEDSTALGLVPDPRACVR